jgi:hypothetical protein
MAKKKIGTVMILTYDNLEFKIVNKYLKEYIDSLKLRVIDYNELLTKFENKLCESTKIETLILLSLNGNKNIIIKYL